MFTGKNSINQQKKKEKGHKRSWSTQSGKADTSSGLPSFSSFEDLNSLSSNNSFNSLRHQLSSTNVRSGTLSPRNNSFDSLNLPDYNSITTKNTAYYRNKTFQKGKKILSSYKGDRSKKGYAKSVLSPRESRTIIEDDESEPAMNIPVLPAFRKSMDAEIPLPRARKSISSNPDSLDTETESRKKLRSALDTDFDINFTKDAALPRGGQILEMRKKKGIPQRRIVIAGSSSDDTSTEGEDSDHSIVEFSPKKVKNDDASMKSETSHSSKKNIFKSIFRRRSSVGAADTAKLPQNEINLDNHINPSTNKEEQETEQEQNQNQNQKHEQEQEQQQEYEREHEKIASIMSRKSSIADTLSRHSGNSTGSSGRFRNYAESPEKKQFDDSLTNSDSIDDEKSYSNEKVKELNDTLGSDFHKHDYQYDHDGSDGYHHNDIRNINNSNCENNDDIPPESSNGEHFLKNIFHMEGLLGQGGLVPNLNLAHNVRRGSTQHDEENPPPNFAAEIKTEAQALVGTMLKAPFDPSRLKKGISHIQEKQRGEESGDQTESIQHGRHHSDQGIYVPDDAHLRCDPFDDLQDIQNFSIDVPKGIQDKPRRLRAGIQSTLLQMYNTHFIPSSLSSSTETTLNESHGNLSDTMSMDIGAEMKHLRHDELEPHLTGAQSLLDSYFTSNKKTESFQEKFSNRKQMGAKRKAGVSFELPDFGQRPNSDNTGFEKAEPSAFKNLKLRAKMNKKRARETKARITVHIADVLERQRFILTLCKAFMLYGAPTHRLEEYMSMTSQVLEIDGSFIYFPGCMLVSFGDLNARTSEMKLVRCAQGLDLGKLDEVHDVYKNVVHDRLGTVEGYKILDEIMNRKPRFNKWWCVFFYALSSLAVTSYGFGGSWIDMPVCLGIGGIIGFLQFVVCPKNTLYSSVFEVTSSIIASFIARAIGSINGGNTFCYAALVQSPLALILPGYIILCGSLELQSRNIVAGSVRMIYAFIYSLMLSFGITLGAALYGWIDSNATSTTTCSSNISPWFRFIFVPMFTVGIALTNQASWSQLPMMVVISSAGYVVTYFSSLHFKQVTELNATLGCFVIGLVSNIYSRFMKSFNKYFTTRGSFITVSLMLPAIFVQVPSGIASQGSVFTGITTANNIVHSNNSTESSASTNSLSFGMVMIQVALGISVGLYLSTIIVYPFGKKRTGLFTL